MRKRLARVAAGLGGGVACDLRRWWAAAPAGRPSGRDPLAAVGAHLRRRARRHQAAAAAAAAAATAALGRRAPAAIACAFT